MANTMTPKKEENVKELLEDIRDNTALPWWRTVLNGFFYSAGFVLGSVFAVALLGWLLSIFGIIPGFGELAARLQEIMNARF